MGVPTCTIAHPQPLGAFPLPAGYLLIDDTSPEAAAVRATLSAGLLPEHWPDDLRGHELAYAGDLAGAHAAFVGEDPITAYNRFVLEPDGVDLAALRAALPESVAPLVDVVGYAVGLTPVPPAAVAEGAGEVRALILAAHASAHLDRRDAGAAAGTLVDAAALAEPVALPLAAVLLGHAATLVHEHELVAGEQDDPDSGAVSMLNRALTLLGDTDLRVGTAELHLQLGLVHHQADRLSEAVEQYHAALRLADRDRLPELWASANLNLGTAYLTMPMTQATDQLRTGIAMQCLRAALEVFTPADHPAQWASAQLNLANALVYSPSTHQGDNVVEAVERYEEVLELRDRDGDPLGRARVLANQGNALAHLGVFDHAKAKLFEARFLFEEHLDHDSALAVRGVLDEIAKQTVPDGAPRAGGFPNASDVAAIRAQQVPVAPKPKVVRIDSEATS